MRLEVERQELGVTVVGGVFLWLGGELGLAAAGVVSDVVMLLGELLVVVQADLEQLVVVSFSL